jgi:predicted ATPase/class 3 adenylate cyclase/DNA-binding CsgD family transcriptional regulator
MAEVSLPPLSDHGPMESHELPMPEFHDMATPFADRADPQPLAADVRLFPTGTVTFLMSDVEGSTRLWEAGEDLAGAAITRHYQLLHSVIAQHRGFLPLEQGEGDSVVGVFAAASDAVEAAFEILRAIEEESWPMPSPLKVRLALHAGEAELQAGGNYHGRTIIRCARLRAIAHGGQALVSDSVHNLVAERLPVGASLRMLGVHRLKDLGRSERVWQLCHPELTSDFPELRSLDSLPNNLPMQLTSFIGRSVELAEIRDALHDARLVTCVGAGGSGKSRLAVQSAADLADEHCGGTWWVDLSPISDSDGVAEALARVLGLRPEHDRDLVGMLAGQLAGQEALLVLDNCEQVVDATAQLVDGLLHGAPSLHVLATSREPLGVPGEVAWRVPSLDDDAAVELFMERARQVRPGYNVRTEEAVVVADICRRLDGLPLAIELAAAQIRMMQPSRIALALDDRFRLLTGGSRTAMARQRTLEASVAWSHDLLDVPEQILFRRLSVFADGFTLEAAERVCADEILDEFAVLEYLTRLVDKSLVQANSGEEGTRYRLLETIRHYAGARLIEADDVHRVRKGHFAYFLELAEGAAPELVRADGPAWLANLELEHENLRAALEWADGAGHNDLFLRMVTALTLFWELHGHLEAGGRWFARALAADDEPSIIRTRALWGSAHVALYGDDHETSRVRASQALAMAKEVHDDWALARSLNTLSYRQLWMDGPAARAALEQSIKLGESIGDEWAVADGLKMITIAWQVQGGLEEVGEPLSQLFKVATQLKNKFFLAWYHYVLGFVAFQRGEFGTARNELERSLDYCREVGDPATGGISLAFLGQVDVLTGNSEAGRARFEDILHRADGSRALGGPFALLFLAQLMIAGGELEGAQFLIDIGIAAADVPLLRSWVHSLQSALELAKGNCDVAQESIEEARKLANESANPWMIAMVADQAARLARRRGKLGNAENLHHEALALQSAMGLRPDVVASLDALALIAAEAQSPLEAVRLFAATDAICAAAGLVRSPDHEKERLDGVELARQQIDPASFVSSFSEGSALTMEEAIAYASRARGERRRPSFGWESLTPTELRVVNLVSEGLTNPQVAERLFIARGTVKVHLGHIFSKLGVVTRSELAAEATRRSIER